MTATVRRITVSLPREQIKSLKNVSKMLKRPVSALVSELIGEAVTSFEDLVVRHDIDGARLRVQQLTDDAKVAIDQAEFIFIRGDKNDAN
jgi:predicted DNA-binding protein